MGIRRVASANHQYSYEELLYARKTYFSPGRCATPTVLWSISCSHYAILESGEREQAVAPLTAPDSKAGSRT